MGYDFTKRYRVTHKDTGVLVTSKATLHKVRDFVRAAGGVGKFSYFDTKEKRVLSTEEVVRG